LDEFKRFINIRDYAKRNNIKGCFVVGGGTSLDNFDLSRLDNEFTLTVNHSVEAYPQSKATIFSDKIFLSKSIFDFSKYKGLVFAGAESGYKDRGKFDKFDQEKLHAFKINRSEPVENPRVGLFHSTSTGLIALNLAIIMGFKKIFLLGYDYYYQQGTKRIHFNGDYPHHLRVDESKMFIKVKKFVYFEKWKDRIWNCNPDSNLKVFRFKPYKEIFK
jgi:hypothetical protein